MTKPVTPERRAELVAVAAELEQQLARLPSRPTDWDAAMAYHRQVDAAARKILEGLRDRFDARFQVQGTGNCRLTCLGVTTTCTSGTAGLLQNWINAARRKAGWEDL